MKILLASAPSYGKVHNVCKSQKAKDDLWIFLEGRA